MYNEVVCSVLNTNLDYAHSLSILPNWTWFIPVTSRISKSLGGIDTYPCYWLTSPFSDRKMPKRGEARVHSAKRRTHNGLRNQFSELTVNYEDLLKENKILKQIQVSQWNKVLLTQLVDFIGISKAGFLGTTPIPLWPNLWGGRVLFDRKSRTLALERVTTHPSC